MFLVILAVCVLLGKKHRTGILYDAGTLLFVGVRITADHNVTPAI